LEGDARLSRIWELQRMSDYERMRQTNIARTQEKLKELGLVSDMRQLMDELKGGGTVKRKETGEGGRKAKRARADDDDFDEEDSDEGGDDEEGGGRGESPTPKARTTRASVRRAAPRGRGARGRAGPARVSQGTVMEGGIPHWAAEARVTLQGEGGVVWGRVLEMWWKCEEAAQFNGPPRGQSPKNRPAQVAAWIARAREGGPKPAIVDVFAFASKWWSWWIEINPEWRRNSKNAEERLAKSVAGEWGGTVQTGANGLLNVLICLRWWRDAIRDTELPAWEEAVGDVHWVLESVG
jgi:hypothetical protein